MPYTTKILALAIATVTLYSPLAQAQSLEQRSTIDAKAKQEECFIAQTNKLGTRKLVRDCNVSCLRLRDRYRLYESEQFPDQKAANKRFLIEFLEICEANYAAAMSSLSADDKALISKKKEEAKEHQEALKNGTLKKNKKPYLGRDHWHQQRNK